MGISVVDFFQWYFGSAFIIGGIGGMFAGREVFVHPNSTSLDVIEAVLLGIIGALLFMTGLWLIPPIHGQIF